MDGGGADAVLAILPTADRTKVERLLTTHDGNVEKVITDLVEEAEVLAVLAKSPEQSPPSTKPTARELARSGSEVIVPDSLDGEESSNSTWAKWERELHQRPSTVSGVSTPAINPTTTTTAASTTCEAATTTSTAITNPRTTATTASTATTHSRTAPHTATATTATNTANNDADSGAAPKLTDTQETSLADTLSFSGLHEHEVQSDTHSGTHTGRQPPSVSPRAAARSGGSISSPAPSATLPSSPIDKYVTLGPYGSGGRAVSLSSGDSGRVGGLGSGDSVGAGRVSGSRADQDVAPQTTTSATHPTATAAAAPSTTTPNTTTSTTSTTSTTTATGATASTTLVSVKRPAKGLDLNLSLTSETSSEDDDDWGGPRGDSRTNGHVVGAQGSFPLINKTPSPPPNQLPARIAKTDSAIARELDAQLNGGSQQAGGGSKLRPPGVPDATVPGGREYTAEEARTSVASGNGGGGNGSGNGNKHEGTNLCSSDSMLAAELAASQYAEAGGRASPGLSGSLSASGRPVRAAALKNTAIYGEDVADMAPTSTSASTAPRSLSPRGPPVVFDESPRLIYHEHQRGFFCGQHCVNALLQGSHFTSQSMKDVGKRLDEREREVLLQGGVDGADYKRFLGSRSQNAGRSGQFSIQVLRECCEDYAIQLVANGSEEARARESLRESELGYIIHREDHWFTLRRIGENWYNLDSLYEYPHLLKTSYVPHLLTAVVENGGQYFIAIGPEPEPQTNVRKKNWKRATVAPVKLLSASARTRSARKGGTAVGDADYVPPGGRGGGGGASEGAASAKRDGSWTLATAADTASARGGGERGPGGVGSAVGGGLRPGVPAPHVPSSTTTAGESGRGGGRDGSDGRGGVRGSDGQHGGYRKSAVVLGVKPPEIPGDYRRVETPSPKPVRRKRALPDSILAEPKGRKRKKANSGDAVKSEDDGSKGTKRESDTREGIDSSDGDHKPGKESEDGTDTKKTKKTSKSRAIPAARCWASTTKKTRCTRAIKDDDNLFCAMHARMDAKMYEDDDDAMPVIEDEYEIFAP